MKRFAVLIAIVVLAVALWSGGWLYVAGQIGGGIDAMAAADPAVEPRLTCDDRSVTGFPFRFDVRCTGAALESGDTTLRIAELQAAALAYRPNHLVGFGVGPIDYDDAFTGARRRLDFEGLEASVRIESWRIARASLEARELVLTDVLFGGTVGTAEQFELHLMDIPEAHDPDAGTAGIAVYQEIQGAEWPELEIADGRQVLEADVIGLPDDIRAWGQTDLARFFADADGTIRLYGLRGSDLVTEVEATGDATLDAEGRLNGAVQVVSTGLAERLGDALPEPQRTIVMGRPDPDGNYTQTLNIRAGVVFAGIVPVGMIPPLR